jgi:hypothetical protein
MGGRVSKKVCLAAVLLLRLLLAGWMEFNSKKKPRKQTNLFLFWHRSARRHLNKK